jgi:pteridine reductase
MTGKTVLITGAAQRIGAAIARDLHDHDMDVVIHYHQSSLSAEKLAAELNQMRKESAFLVQGDLLDFACYEEIIERAYGINKRLDVLVNNASSFFPTPVGHITIEQWQKLIGVNMQAPLFLAQFAAEYLAASQGCIINITDIHAIRPLKDHPVYSAAKAGLVALTMALAKELGPAVRVNGISPGAILWAEHMDSERQKDILEKVTLERTGEVEDVVNAVRFLISESSYTTGQILTVDGGRTLYS